MGPVDYAIAWLTAGALAVSPSHLAAQASSAGQAPSRQPAPAAGSASAKAIELPTLPTEPAPTETTLGVPVYPNAQFLRSYDAGRGQRFYLFGAPASFAEIAAYYRTILKQRGELLFERPGTLMFEVGRYREETMAFPPSVTVKDFASSGSEGYPNPKPGAQPSRFPTVIQIVPVSAAGAR
jgi:hypothetical protein